MKRILIKYIRTSLAGKSKAATIAQSLGINSSVLIRHWINDVPVISARRRKLLNELKLNIKNTGSNTTQMRRHLETRGENRHGSIKLKLYNRDLHNIHWQLRQQCMKGGKVKLQQRKF